MGRQRKKIGVELSPTKETKSNTSTTVGHWKYLCGYLVTVVVQNFASGRRKCFLKLWLFCVLYCHNLGFFWWGGGGVVCEHDRSLKDWFIFWGCCAKLTGCVALFQVGRLETQVKRYKSDAERAEGVEDELKQEKRKLQREVSTLIKFKETNCYTRKMKKTATQKT